MLNVERCINTLSSLCLQCSRGTLSYIQSQCQSALSNLASEPETGAHRLLSLLPATLQHCEEIHNEVSNAAAAAATCATACTCGKAVCGCACRAFSLALLDAPDD